MAKNKDEDVLVPETEETGGDLRVYELGFHLDPELPIEEVKKAYQAIRGLIAERGTIIAEVQPEKIQLAYTISRQDVGSRRDFSSAYFSWIVYETTAVPHAEIIAAAQAHKFVIRFIDLVTTKDEARHALEVHELLAKMPEGEPSPEEVMDTELDTALESVKI
ncbi:MAG TPA: 30S ribosomal protein S6 [Candidatus Paceibacterota bacterium]|nr:30S ribosomal protein S6 [Candidatus Paceibacterota bacterium]